MKRTLTIVLAVIVLMLSISIVPTSAHYINNAPSSYWNSSDATGFYLTINPVRNTNLKYRVFCNFRKNITDKPSSWIAVADYTLSKAKKVHVTLPSSVRKQNRSYVNYTVRTWTKDAAGKTVYTSDFVRNNVSIEWSRSYKVKRVTSSGKNLIVNLPYSNGDHSKWYIFAKNFWGSWVTIGTTTSSRYTLSEKTLRNYMKNNKIYITIREYDFDHRCWMGGYCNPAVSITYRNNKFIPSVVNTPVK